MTDNSRPKVAVLYTYPQTVVEDIGRLMKLEQTYAAPDWIVDDERN